MDQLINTQGELLSYLKKFGLRLRLRDTWLLAQRSLWQALAGCALLLLAGRIWPIENIRIWATLPLAFWLIGLAGFAVFQPLPPLRVARRVDGELHLKERLSTSLLLDQATNKDSAFDALLVAKQHADALAAAHQVQPAADFPLRAERRSLLAAGLALAVAAVLVFAPNPMDDVLRERAEVAREAERQAQQIDKLREEIAQSQEMTPEQREELLRRLSELADKLRNNPGDRAQALADLSQLEEQLRQQLDPKAGQKQAMLSALAAQLQAMANQQDPADGDLQAAADAAEALAEQMKDMSPEELQAMAQQLSQMASRAAQAGNAPLAQALAAMGQAAQNGDLSAAESAASQAANALQQAQGEMADQRALSQTLSQLQNSRQSVSSSSQSGQQSAQSGQNSQPGQSGQSGQPGQNGQSGQSGQSGQNGQGQQAGGGGGTTANNLPGATRTGRAGSPQGQANAGGVSPLENQVYVPREKLPSGNGEMVVPGQDTDQGSTQSSQQNDPLGGINNPALIPYQTVYQNYLETANQAIDQSYIPPGMKDYIRSYFSQLAP